MIKEYVDFMGIKLDEIRSMGGGAKSKIWCSIKSGLLEKRIVTLKQNETACLGSAIFAGVGVGVFESPVDATEKIVAIDKTYEVSIPEYKEVYENYKKKEKKLMEVFN